MNNGEVIKYTESGKRRYYEPELGGWVPPCRLFKWLKSINKTQQDWYDKNILGIEDPIDRPKCPICGKDCKFNNIVLGYNRTCSFYHGRILCGREDAEHHSEVMTEYYKDPDNRLKTSVSIKNAYDKDPELRKKVSIGTKNGCNKPGRRERRSEVHRLSWLNPTEAMLNPKNRCNKGNNVDYSGIKSSVISVFDPSVTLYFDSNWEKLYYYDRTLDDNVLNVTRWKLPLRYIRPSDGKVHAHFPDFIVEYKDGRKVIVEIKPKRKAELEDNVAKIKAAKSYAFLHGYGYELVTEENYNFDRSRIFSMPI